jgi:3-dehydroquinate synthase
VLRRSEPIIAIGGGVLLDLVGFCCSIYRRGIPYVRIPTTLLAIVDASVGAKTSINHFDRRNRIGSFYPPVSTLIDKSFIKTQDRREIANGMAEILKLAIVLDYNLFEMMELAPQQLLSQKFQNHVLADQIIDRAISGMTQELNDNLWERDLQRPVDFGHSFSPMVEMKNVPKLLHGEAVILDCLLSSCISNLRGYLSNDHLERIFKTIKNCSLPTEHEDFYDVDLLWKGLNDVMTHRNGNQYLPIPISIGRCEIINDVTYNELQQATQRLKSLQ